MENISSLVVELRKKLGGSGGISQQALAVSLGMSVRAIANYEAGRKPAIGPLIRMARLAKDIDRDLAKIFWGQVIADLQEMHLDEVGNIWYLAVAAARAATDADAKVLAPDIVMMLESIADRCERINPSLGRSIKDASDG